MQAVVAEKDREKDREEKKQHSQTFFQPLVTCVRLTIELRHVLTAQSLRAFDIVCQLCEKKASDFQIQTVLDVNHSPLASTRHLALGAESCCPMITQLIAVPESDKLSHQIRSQNLQCLNCILSSTGEAHAGSELQSSP